MVVGMGLAVATPAFAQAADDERNIQPGAALAALILNPNFIAAQKENLKKGIIRIDGEINQAKQVEISTLIDYLDQTLSKNQAITFIINSEGGEADAGNAIADKIKFLSRPTIAIAEGTAQSIAFTIFMAADKRIAYPTSFFMQHPVSARDDRKLSKAEKRENQAVIDFQNRLADVELDGRTKLSNEQLKTMFSGTCLFGSAFALKYGFLTEIRAAKGQTAGSLPEGATPKPIHCPNWPKAEKMLPGVK